MIGLSNIVNQALQAVLGLQREAGVALPPRPYQQAGERAAGRDEAPATRGRESSQGLPLTAPDEQPEQALLAGGPRRALMDASMPARAGTSGAHGVDGRPLSNTVSANARLLELSSARTPGTSTSISSASSLLARIATDTSIPAPPASVVAAQPAAQAFPGDPYAGAVRDSIVQSGLFYESHLRDWSAGQLALERILREPQARHSRRHANESNPRAAALDTTSSTADVAGASPAQGSGAGNDAVIPRPLEPIVREQLNTLAQREMTIPLVVWPEQPALLTIAEEHRQDAPAGAAEAAPWTAKLVIDLPRLGRVQFQLRSTGDDLRLQVRAGQLAAASELDSNIAALRESLSARALTLVESDIGHDQP